MVSSADLVQYCEARWSAEGLASHRRAAQGLREVLQATFKEVATAVGAGREPSEYAIQQFMMSQYKERGLFADPPIVAVNAHAGNPHYEPRERDSAPIRRGDLLLLDLWCREEPEGSIWADITWMAYLGPKVPDKHREIWDIVAGARDAAVAFLRESVARGKRVRGSEVDEVSRAHVRDRGYAERFLHRTGHSIGFEVHGNGCNIDSLETIDERTELCHRMQLVDERDRRLLFLWYVMELRPGDVARRIRVSRVHCYRLRQAALSALCDEGDS